MEKGWLANAAYENNRIILTLLRNDTLQPFTWTDPEYRPYYLTEDKQREKTVKRLDLFTEQERSLAKVEYSTRPQRNTEGWEVDISPSLSYVYDEGLRFGILHEFRDDHWIPQAQLTTEEDARLKNLLSQVSRNDPLKESILREAYSYSTQSVPNAGPKALGLPEENWSQEEYHRAVLLSRLTNLPLRITYRKNAAAEWLRGMLHSYYRTHNILIPNSDELRLGSDKQAVTGALTITPASGTYFNMVVLDFESLYPGVIDVYDLSYETVRCPHSECRDNLVPGLDYHICRRRRGIYSAILGALRELRLHHFKPISKTLPSDTPEGRIARGASQALKLLLNASYGVTIRIHGLASPLLAEAITAYGRHVLQTTYDMAKERGLNPKYGDTDSVFLDNPSEEQVEKFVQEIRTRFSLELAYDRKYDVCVLSNAMKAYFGVLPHGEPEIKGLTIAKSNSPRFFLTTFQECLKALAKGRRSPQEFEQAKGQVQTVVTEALKKLRKGQVALEDLEYKVEIRDDPALKSRAKTIPQPYQAAILLLERGVRVTPGEEVGFVKVHPFKHTGRYFTVKPFSQATGNELNVDDYIRNLTSSLQQTFEPMGITLKTEQAATGLDQFR
jgi:DNA polymerase, archaea type